VLQASARDTKPSSIVNSCQEGRHVSIKYGSDLEPFSSCCREERSQDTEGQIKFLVYTLEIASYRADATGEKGNCCASDPLRSMSVRPDTGSATATQSRMEVDLPHVNDLSGQ